MSRIGTNPIPVPSGLKVQIEQTRVVVEGPKGTLETPVPAGIKVELKGEELLVTRANDQPKTRGLHGLTRALLANSVNGINEGFQKQLDVVGIGYRAQAKGKALNLSLGHSHPIEFPIPEGIEVKVERAQRTIGNYIGTITISGANKYLVGQVAADIRALRPPDAYKGKGVRYSDEIVRTKVGKKGAA